MKTIRRLITCVVYPGVESYLPDFIDSVINQTCRNEFDWLVVNDGMDRSIKRLFPRDVAWINMENAVTPGGIRRIMIDFAINEDYEQLFFSDTDDILNRNYVSTLSLQLDKYGFAYCELFPFFNKGKRIEPFLTKHHPAKGLVISDIIDRNLIGMTHSAVNVSCLHEITIPENIKVADWYLYSTILLSGITGTFVPSIGTFYRQTETNTVGVSKKLDEIKLDTGIAVKILHYESMANFCNEYGAGKYKNVYLQKLQEMQFLSERIKDSSFRKKYIKIINKNYERIYNGWWSEILPLEQWREYERFF